MRKSLTDKWINGKEAVCPPGAKSLDVFDAITPGLCLRITPNVKRWTYFYTPPGGSARARMLLGTYCLLAQPGEVLMGLDAARAAAMDARRLLDKGVDPAQHAEDQARAQTAQRAITFGNVFADFTAAKLPQERSGADVARDVIGNFKALWERPMAEIVSLEIRAILTAKKKTATKGSHVRNLLGYVRRFYGWAIDQARYGVTINPCSSIKAGSVAGKKKKRDRVLSDDELFALWRWADRAPFPVGPAYKILMLNALRLNEAVDAEGKEIDYRKREWLIPADRMKGSNEEAVPHMVPLTNATLAILGQLPTPTAGPAAFSFNKGRSPAAIGSKIKNRADIAMLRTLKALARKRGQDPREVELEPWVNHDIRRTVRTNLSALRDRHGRRIDHDTKEAIMAHVKSGVHGVYDRYELVDEKLEALELWAVRLEQIVSGKEPADNVFMLRAVA